MQIVSPSRSSQSLLNRCSGLKGNWSFLYLLSRFDTSRFDTNSSSETAKNFRSLQVKFAVEQEKNILGEYSSFFKPSTWNYLYLEGISLYRNDFVSAKRPVTVQKMFEAIWMFGRKPLLAKTFLSHARGQWFCPKFRADRLRKRKDTS